MFATVAFSAAYGVDAEPTDSGVLSRQEWTPSRELRLCGIRSDERPELFRHCLAVNGYDDIVTAKAAVEAHGGRWRLSTEGSEEEVVRRTLHSSLIPYEIPEARQDKAVAATLAATVNGLMERLVFREKASSDAELQTSYFLRQAARDERARKAALFLLDIVAGRFDAAGDLCTDELAAAMHRVGQQVAADGVSPRKSTPAPNVTYRGEVRRPEGWILTIELSGPTAQVYDVYVVRMGDTFVVSNFKPSESH